MKEFTKDELYKDEAIIDAFKSKIESQDWGKIPLQTKSITFDKQAQDNLPKWVKDKMKSDRLNAKKEQVLLDTDLIVVELSDEEIKIITVLELKQWHKDAMEFDGFEGWIVRGKLVKI